MRSFFFAVGFWWVSILYVLMAAVLALVPGAQGRALGGEALFASAWCS